MMVHKCFFYLEIISERFLNFCSIENENNARTRLKTNLIADLECNDFIDIWYSKLSKDSKNSKFSKDSENSEDSKDSEDFKDF